MLFLEGKTESDRVQLRYGGTKRAKRQQGSEHDVMGAETVLRHGVTFRWRSIFSSTPKDKLKNEHTHTGNISTSLEANESSLFFIHFSTHPVCSSSNALIFVTCAFLLIFLNTTNKSAGNVRANPVVSSGSGCTGAGFTGGMYIFTLGSFFDSLRSALVLNLLALGGGGSSSGAVFLACFLRVAELAEDFGLPLTMVEMCDKSDQTNSHYTILDKTKFNSDRSVLRLMFSIFCYLIFELRQVLAEVNLRVLRPTSETPLDHIRTALYKPNHI